MNISGKITVTLPNDKVATFDISDGEFVVDEGILSVWDYALRGTPCNFNGQIGAYAKGAWLTVAFDPIARVEPPSSPAI